MRSRRLRVAAAVVATLVAATGGALAAELPSGSRSPLAKPAPAAAYDPAGVLSGADVHGMILVKTCLPNKASDSDLQRLKALGINTIVLVLCSFVDNSRASKVYTDERTPTTTEIRALTNRIHAAGLAVQYVPMFAPGGNYFTRWKIKPTSVKSFFSSYQKFVLKWADLAADLDVELFSLGNEAGPYLESKWKKWRTMVRAINKRYHGLLTYQTTALHVFDLRWWKMVDLISTSAHFSLTAEARPPVDELKHVWRTYYFPKLRKLSAKFRRPVLFAEIGYASVLGTAHRPAAGNRTREPRSQGAQADAYDAFLDTSSRLGSWFRGANWFYWHPSNSDVGATDTSYSPRDKKAECVLARAWSHSTLSKVGALREAPTACALAAQTL